MTESTAHVATGPNASLEKLVRIGKRKGRYLWLVGLALYLGVVGFLGWDGLAEALASANIRFILALMGIEVISISLRVLKWRIALGPGQGAAPIFFLSKAAGNLTPGRIGELSPLLIAKHRNPKVGAWIITDRLLEMTATLALGLIGLAAFGIGNHGLLLAAIVTLLLVTGTVAYALTRRRTIERLIALTREGTLARRGLQVLLSVSEEVNLLGAKVPLLALMTLTATSLDIYIGVLLFGSFGIWIPFLILALMQVVHAVTSVIPITPNATGIPYAAAAAFLHQAAGVPIEVLAVAVPVRIAAGSLVFWSAFGIGVSSGKTRRAFSDQGALFDQLASGTALYSYSPDALKKLNRLVENGGSVLDVGCGDGLIGQALDGDPVVGIDISPRCAALSRDKGLKCTVADATGKLPFADNTFDTVACIDVLHHLGQAWDTIFPELDRVLKTGGRLVIVEPDARNPFVRWTQAPESPIRVAPWHDEPAIDPADLLPHLQQLGYAHTCEPIHIEGAQQERSVFPLWQRLLKAPFVIALAFYYRSMPNKFALVARKPA